jgi:hypothetical protein
MAERRPLRLRTCESCNRNFYSRSPLSRYCCVAHQVKEWRAANKFTQQELAEQFINQELENTSQSEQGAAT